MGVQVGVAPGQGAAGTHFQDWRRREVASRDVRPQFRLRPGQDDVLIEWLASLAPRQRSAAIREALYQHLAACEGVGDDGEWTEDPDLAAALDSLF